LKGTVFGREFTLSTDQIKLLADLPFNGVQLSFESGYEQLGGRTLYILFTKGFISHRVTGKLVILNERGDVSIQDSTPQ
jgi:hypothetical protein